MFFLGVFTSHVPYVILILAYLVGFVNVSTNEEQVNKNEVQNSIDSSLLTFFSIQDNRNTRDKCFKYFDCKNSISEKESYSMLFFHKFKIDLARIISCQKYIRPSFLYRYVALPPPVDSLL